MDQTVSSDLSTVGRSEMFFHRIDEGLKQIP